MSLLFRVVNTINCVHVAREHYYAHHYPAENATDAKYSRKTSSDLTLLPDELVLIFRWAPNA